MMRKKTLSPWLYARIEISSLERRGGRKRVCTARFSYGFLSSRETYSPPSTHTLKEEKEAYCDAHRLCIYLGGPSGPHHLCSTTVYNPYPLDTPFQSPTVSSTYHESYTFYDSTSHLF
jgi:hypothetical protein